MENIQTYIQQGGIFIWPILFCALWSLVIFFERTFFYIQTASQLNRQEQRIFEELYKNGIESVEKMVGDRKGLIKNVLATAIANRHKPLDRVEEKMEVILLNHLPEYSKYLNLMATLAGIMPMLGLLGTVTGMIATFKVIALQGTGDAQAMADGISEALITTQAGMIAAVPVIIMHQFLANRLKKISDKTHSICAQFIDYLKDSND